MCIYLFFVWLEKREREIADAITNSNVKILEKTPPQGQEGMGEEAGGRGGGAGKGVEAQASAITGTTHEKLIDH